MSAVLLASGPAPAPGHRAAAAASALPTSQAREALCEMQAVGKAFDGVRALHGVDLRIDQGERIGVVGHNGAGKSTLINLLNGALRASSGRMHWAGAEVGARWSMAAARQAGVRCVFQELSLVPTLTPAENLRLMQPALRGWGWHARALQLLRTQLETVFPGSAIDLGLPIEALPIGHRQMVEIACAFIETTARVRLVVLDEPTSSLTSQASAQLIAHLRRGDAQGPAVVLVSHKMKEVFGACQRIVAMKDGQKVLDEPADRVDTARLIRAMGDHGAGAPASHASPHAPPQAAAEPARAAGPVLVEHVGTERGAPVIALRAGEVIGLGGLAGHGQSEALAAMQARRPRGRAAAAFVPGDRQNDGVFALWSVERNFSASIYGRLSRRGYIRRGEERAATQQWCRQLNVKTASLQAPMVTLSGGNQQKVLFARALATPCPVVLMDDPTRGVDIATKRDMYARIRQEAQAGRGLAWYSTDHEELAMCDRVYIFHEGRVAGVLARAEFTEEAALGLSFREAACAP